SRKAPTANSRRGPRAWLIGGHLRQLAMGRSATWNDSPGTRAQNRNADITKWNISTSSEALTTARVVATEVPSMVGSAWYPTYEATSAAVPPNTADLMNALTKSLRKSTASCICCQTMPESMPSTCTPWNQLVAM